MRPGLLLPLFAFFLLLPAGCHPGKPAPGTGRGPARAAPPGPAPGPEIPARRPPVPGRAPEAPRPPRVPWPRGWRLVAAGGLGPAARPSFWWILDAGHEDPGRVVERAREALGRRFGNSPAPSPAAAVHGDTAVGVFSGPRGRGAITARRSDGRTEVRIVLGTGVE